MGIMNVENAFILAAGKGTRLRPYTDHCPKPMVQIGGRALIDHIIDHLSASSVRNIFINLHYKGDMIRNHLATRTDVSITFLNEDTLLDTGLGIKKALPLLQGNPFFAVNGDAFWKEMLENDKPSILELLKSKWDDENHDLVLALQDIKTMHLTEGVGDYDIDENNIAARNKEKQGRYMFTSIRLCHPRLFENTPDQPFSFLHLMDKAEAAGKLDAVTTQGQWHHISTAHDLEAVNRAYSEGVL
jgi:MurNAc alpha-1-phosphate uridylyltransferase